MSINITDFKLERVKKVLNLKGFSEPIEIYNADGEQWESIRQEFFEQLRKDELKDITSREMLFLYLPMFSNVSFDGIEDELIILKILDNPPNNLRIVCDEVTEVLRPILRDAKRKYMTFVKEINKDLDEMTKDLTPEQINSFIASINNMSGKDDFKEAYEINEEYDKVLNTLKQVNNQDIFNQSSIYKLANNVK